MSAEKLLKNIDTEIVARVRRTFAIVSSAMHCEYCRMVGCAPSDSRHCFLLAAKVHPNTDTFRVL
eukprot:4579265-Pyramimonas_sp.AAC.2